MLPLGTAVPDTWQSDRGLTWAETPQSDSSESAYWSLRLLIETLSDPLCFCLELPAVLAFGVAVELFGRIAARDAAGL